MANAVLLKEFPNLRQTYNYDCGAQALQSVLAYYGIDIREGEIIRVAKTTKKYGTTSHNLALAIEHYGLKYDMRERTIDEVKDLISQNVPVILSLQAWTEDPDVDWKNDWNDGHYAVAIGYDDKKIIFEDPSNFQRAYLSYEELEDRWHDKDADGEKYDHLGIAVYGTPHSSCEEFVHMG